MSPRNRQQLEAGLVELVAAESAAEAERLAAQLRQLGIAAIANAEFVRPHPSHTGHAPPSAPRSFVLVPKAELDRAWDAIHAAQRREGPATDEEIRAALARGDDGYGDGDEHAADGAPAPSTIARVIGWSFEQAPRLLLLGVLGCVLWMCFRH